MTEPDFDPATLDKTMPQKAQDAIMLLLRTWAIFEIALTDWLVAVSGMKDDVGVLIVGRMDSRAKIDKLKEVYAHLRDKPQVESLKNLGKSAKAYSETRNTVVHCIYMGYRQAVETPDKFELIYSTHRPTKGHRETIVAMVVGLDNIKKAAKFAANAASKITSAIREQRR